MLFIKEQYLFLDYRMIPYFKGWVGTMCETNTDRTVLILTMW